MGHYGHHNHGTGGDAGRLAAAFCVIAVFAVVEIVGGLLANSLALIADAGHMATDAFALALAAGAHVMSARPPSDDRPYGNTRLQVIAAFLNGLVLFALIGWIAIEAGGRIISPAEVQSGPMLAVAVAGLVANIVAFAILHRGADNVNVRGALLHVLSDLYGSAAAIAAALVIMATGWMLIDPILSLFVVALIARSAWRLVSETFHVLMEGAPPGIDLDALKADLAANTGARDIHALRVSMVTPEIPRLTMHVCAGDAERVDAVLREVRTFLAERYRIYDATIQVEVAPCPELEQVAEGGVAAPTPARAAKPEQRSGGVAAASGRPAPAFVSGSDGL